MKSQLLLSKKTGNVVLMLQFKDLSPAQQKFVLLVELHFPQIKERGTITYKEINEVHDFFLEKRKENKNYKVMKALWLVTNNKIERSLYKFPLSEEKVAPPSEPLTEWDLMYQAELARYGITPLP
jgi:hypothetical protein